MSRTPHRQLKASLLPPGGLRLALRKATFAAALSLATLASFGATDAGAAVPAPHLSIRTVALPSWFAPEDETDQYTILITNTGGVPTDPEDPINIGVSISGAVITTLIAGQNWNTLEGPECTLNPAGDGGQCTVLESLPPDDTFNVGVNIKALSATGSAQSEVTVSGGGAEAVSAVAETPLSAEPVPFAIEELGFDGTAADGSPERQAAGHPFVQTTSFEVLSDENKNVEELYRPAKSLRELSFMLPEGFVGNPQVTPRCDLSDLEKVSYNPLSEFLPACPSGSRIGDITLISGRSGGATGSAQRGYRTTPIYNLKPEAGHPAEFGFIYFQYAVVFYADLAHTGSGYRIHVTVPGVPNINLDGVVVSLFGNPGARNEVPGAHRPFFTNPSRCSGEALSTRFEVDSWEEPSGWLSSEKPFPTPTGCNRLQFNPTFSLHPDTTSAASPAGLNVDLGVPQNEDPEGLGTPPLRDATVTLPRGIAVDPSSADGLQGCSEAQIAPDSTQPGNCPLASTIGDATLETPLLDHSLAGKVFLGTPDCSPCSGADAEAGRLLKLYIEVNDPLTGVVVKLPGMARANPQTGQLTASFKDNPQFPFEDLKLNFKTGPRAPLSTPPTCGHYTTTTDLAPWSAPETPAATPSSDFELNSGPGGSACSGSEAAEPNKPSFSAGTASPTAGAYSPFTLKLSRQPGSQVLKGLNVTLPPGLIGRLAGTSYCPEAQIAAAAHKPGAAEKASPSCSAASEVGTVNVGAGAGAPYYVGGHVYLAGPYKGAPLSMAFITPAVAGPFDLGTVVVRSALYVNPQTAQITVKSDPFPTILAGVPLDLRSVAVNISRNQFTLNPTSCEKMTIGAEAISALDQAASLANPFQVGGCNSLGFKPKLAINLKGSTKRGGAPALRAVLTYPKGAYANIAGATVSLPHAEFLDQAHIRTVCTKVQLAARQCPAGSIYGFARAFSPLLDKPLEGPVYLGTGYGHELPDLIVDLNGQIEVLLDGRIDTGKNHGIRTTFASVPDAPVSKFVLEMKGGSKGLLENSEDLCRRPGRATAKFTAQNGKGYEVQPLLSNSCKKVKPKKKHHHGGR